jgi:hypothetical protein
MASTITPSQFGYTAPGSTLGSQIFLGRDLSLSFEGVGFGEGGRPDILESLKINICINSGIEGNSQNAPQKIASFNISYSDIRSLYTGNSNFPSTPEFKLRQFSVCEINDSTQESEERNVAFFASQSYATGAGNTARQY